MFSETLNHKKRHQRPGLPIRYGAALFVIGVCLGAGCNTNITAERADPNRIEESYPVFVNHRLQNLEVDSVNFLAFFGLTERFEAEPEAVLRELYERGTIAGDTNTREIIADLCYYQAGRESHPVKQAAYYLTTAQTAWRYLFEESDAPERVKMWWYYNNALRHLFEYLKGEQLLLASGFELEPICGPRVYFEPNVNLLSEALEKYPLMEACADWTARNNQVFSCRRGIGLPLILHTPVRHDDRAAAGAVKPVMFEPATLILRFAPETAGHTRQNARLEFIDSVRYEALNSKGQSVPLAMDITTSLAYALCQPSPFRDIYFLLNPEKMADLEGLYLSQPWQPDKIPVIMTHGLLSNPRTWAQMLNSLYLDSRLRRHYQFWFFAYPTGNPLLYSASRLRAALQSADRQYGEGNANFHQMVLIGHSMGGLLSKTMITDTGDELEEFILKDKQELLKELSPEQRQYIDRLLRFERAPYIQRVIFIATPHRGSSIATWSIIHWASSFIALPKRVYDMAHDGMMDLGLLPKTKDFYIRTGLDNLAPDDNTLQKLNELNFHTVPFHTVSGNLEDENAPGGTDGIVPYTSSHLDGAVSELVVKSNHSVQMESKAIAEVNRILIQHLVEAGRLTPEGGEIDRGPVTAPELPFADGKP